MEMCSVNVQSCANTQKSPPFTEQTGARALQHKIFCLNPNSKEAQGYILGSFPFPGAGTPIF